MEIGKPGPFQVIEAQGPEERSSGSLDVPIPSPRRRYSCSNYETCLNLACALNWDSFTCRGCSGQISNALLWRAHGARKKDKVARSLTAVPSIVSPANK